MSWRGLPAPAVPLGDPYVGTGPAVWGIRFATPEHGFVFGNGLWVTTSGGTHWSAVPYPGGAIMSLEVVDGQVLAVTARHEPNGLTAASWLYYSADNGKTWRTVVSYLDGGDGWNDLGFTTGRQGVVIHGQPAHGDLLGQLLTTENSGLTWHAVKF